MEKRKKQFSAADFVILLTVAESFHHCISLCFRAKLYGFFLWKELTSMSQNHYKDKYVTFKHQVSRSSWSTTEA